MEARGASGASASRASSPHQDLDEVPSLKRRRVSSVCSLVSPRDSLDSSSKNGSRSRRESFSSQSLLLPSAATSSRGLASVQRTEALHQTPSRDRSSLATAFRLCSEGRRTSRSMAKAPVVSSLSLFREAVPSQSSPSTSCASSPLASSALSHVCSSFLTRGESGTSAAAFHTGHARRDSGHWPPACSAASPASFTTPANPTLSPPSARKQLPAFSASSLSSDFPASLGRSGSSPRGRNASPLSPRPENGEREGLSSLGGKNPCRADGAKEARRESTCREKDEMMLHRDTSSSDDMEEETQRSSSSLRQQKQPKGAHTVSTNAREARPPAVFNVEHATTERGDEDQGHEREEDSGNDERDSGRGCICDRASADGERRPAAEAVEKKGRCRDRIEERERKRERREQRRSFLSPSHSASVSSAASETEREKWRTRRRRVINGRCHSVSPSSPSPSGSEEEVGSEEEDSEYFLLPLQQREQDVRDAHRRRSRKHLRSFSRTREEAESICSSCSSRSRRRRRRRGREQGGDESVGDSEECCREESEDTPADEESEEATCTEYDAENWTSSSDWEVNAMGRSRLSRRFRRYISSTSAHGFLDPHDLSVSRAALRHAFARRPSCSDRDSAVSFSYVDWRRRRPPCTSCRTLRSPSLYLLSEELVASCDLDRSRKAPAALWRESAEASEEEATRLRRWKAEGAERRDGGKKPKRRRDRGSRSDRLSSSSPCSVDSESDNDAWASLSSRRRASQQRRPEWRGSGKVGDRGSRRGGRGEERHFSSSGSTEEESEAESGRRTRSLSSLNEESSSEEGEESESGGAREGLERESEGCEEDELEYCEVSPCEGRLSRFGKATRAREIDGARAGTDGKRTRGSSGDRTEDMPDFDRNASALDSFYGSRGLILRRGSVKDAARAQERSAADETDEVALSHGHEVATGDAERVPAASASAEGRREDEATRKRLVEKQSDKDRSDRRREANLREERGGGARSRRRGERGGEQGESERARQSEGRRSVQHVERVSPDAHRRRARASRKWHKMTEPPPVAGREARRFRAVSPRQERRKRHRLMAAANRLVALASGAFGDKGVPGNPTQCQTVFEESPRGQLDQLAFLEASRWLEEVENLHHCEDMTVIFQAVVFHPHVSDRVVAALAVWSVAWLLPSLLPFPTLAAAETPSGQFNFGAVLALLLPSFYSPAALSSSPGALHPARREARESGQEREPKNGDAGQVQRNGERGEAETPSQPKATRTTWVDPPPAVNCRLASMRCMLQAFLFARPSFAVVFLAYFADCLDDQPSSHKAGSSSSVASSPVSSPASPFAFPSALLPSAVAPLSSSLCTASSGVSFRSAAAPRRSPAEARRRRGGGAEAGGKRVAAFLASVAGEGVASGKSGMTVGVCSQDFLMVFSKNEEREKKENALALKRVEGQDTPFIFSSLSAPSSTASVPFVSSLLPQGSWSGREAAEETRAGAKVGKAMLTNNEATRASENLTDTNVVEEKCSCVTSATNTETLGRVERTIAYSVLSDVHINSPSVRLSMASSSFLESVEAQAEARTARLLLRLQLSPVFQETLWNAPLLRAFLLNLALGFLLRCSRSSSLPSDATSAPASPLCPSRGVACSPPHACISPPLASSSDSRSSGHSMSPSVSSCPHFPCWLCLQGQCGGPVALCASRWRLLGPFFLLLDSLARVWNSYISGLARPASEPSLESSRSVLVSKSGDETIGRENEASAANAEKARTAAEAPCGGGVPDGVPPSWKESGSGVYSSFLPGVCSPSLRSVLVCVSLACEHTASSFRHRDARCVSPSTIASSPYLGSSDSSLSACLGVFADPENVARVLDAVLLHLGVSLLWLLSVQGCLVSLSKLQQPSSSSSPPGTSTPSGPPPSVAVSSLSPSLCLLSSSRRWVRELKSLALAVMEWMRHVASARQYAVLTCLHARSSSVLASPCGPSRLSFSPLASSGFSLLGLAAPLAASACDALLRAPAPRLCAFCTSFPPSCLGTCPAKLAALSAGEVPKEKTETFPSVTEAKEEPHKVGESQGEGLGEEPGDAHGRLDEMRQAAEKRAGRDSLKVLWDLFVGQETRRPAQGERFYDEHQNEVSTATRSAACASSSPPAGDAEVIGSGASRFSFVSSGQQEEELLHLIFSALTGGPSVVCLSSSSPFPQPSPVSDSYVSTSSFSSPALFARSVTNGFLGLDSLVSRLASATTVEGVGGQRGDAVASKALSPLEVPVQPPCLSNTSPRWLVSSRVSLSRPSASASPGYALLSVFLRSAAVGIYTRLGKLERLLRFSADFTKSAHQILLHAACLQKRPDGEAGKAAEAGKAGEARKAGDTRGDSEHETAARDLERRCPAGTKESDEGGGGGALTSRPQLLRVRGCTCLAYGVEAVGDICFSRFPSRACSYVSAASSRCLPSLSLASSPMAAPCAPSASDCLPTFSSADIASLVALSLPLPLALHSCAAAAFAAPSFVSLAFVCISLPCSSKASPSTVAPRPSSSLPTTSCSPSDCSLSSASSASPRPPFLLRESDRDAACETTFDACLLTPFLQGSEETAGRGGAAWTEPKQGEIGETTSHRGGRDVDDATPALRILPSVPFLRLCISRVLLRLLPDARPPAAILSTPLVSMSPLSPFSSCSSSSLHPSSIFMGHGDRQSSLSQSQETQPGQIPSGLPPPVSLLPRCDQLVYANLYDALAAEDSPCGPQRRPKASFPAGFSASASSASPFHSDSSRGGVGAAQPLAQAARVVFPSASAKGTLLSLHPASTSRSLASLAVSSSPLSSSPAAAPWLPSTCCYALFSRLLWREISSEDNLLLEVGSWLYPDESNEDWDIFLSPALVAPPLSAGLWKASPPASSRRADSETLARAPGPCSQPASEARQPLPEAQVAVLSSKEIYLYRSELLQALALTLALPLLRPPRRGRERRDGRRLRALGRRPGEARGRSRKAGKDWEGKGRTGSRGASRGEARGTEAEDSVSGVSSEEGQGCGGSRVSLRSAAPQKGKRGAGRERRRRESPQDEDDPGERKGLPAQLRDPCDVDVGLQVSSLPTEQDESRVEEQHTRKGVACLHGNRSSQQSRTRLRALTAFSVDTRQDPPPPLTSPAFLLRLCRFTAFRVLSVFLEKRDREEYVETLERAMHEAVWGESRPKEREKVHGAPEEAGSEKTEARSADARKESEGERGESADKGGDESDHDNTRACREKEKKKRHVLHFGGADTARKKAFATEGQADLGGERRLYGDYAMVGFDDECIHLSRVEESYRRRGSRLCERIEETSGSSAEEVLESEAGEGRAESKARTRFTASCGRGEQRRRATCRSVVPFLSRSGDGRRRGNKGPRGSRCFASSGCNSALDERLLRANFFSLPVPSRSFFSLESDLRGGESERRLPTQNSPSGVFSPFCLGRDRLAIEVLMASPTLVSSSTSSPPPASPSLASSSPTPDRRSVSPRSRSTSSLRSSSPALSLCSSGSASLTPLAAPTASSPCRVTASSASASFPERLEEVGKHVEAGPTSQPPSDRAPAPSSAVALWPAENLQAHGLHSCLALLDALRSVGASLASSPPAASASAALPGGPKAWRTFFACTVDRLLEDLLFMLLPGNSNRMAPASGPEALGGLSPRLLEWGDKEEGVAFSSQENRAGRSERQARASRAATRRDAESTKALREAEEQDRRMRKPLMSWSDRRSGRRSQRYRGDYSDSCDEEQDDWAQEARQRCHESAFHDFRSHAPRTHVGRFMPEDVDFSDTSNGSRSPPPLSSSSDYATPSRRRTTLSSSAPRSALFTAAVLRLNRVTHALFSPLVLHLLVRLLSSSSARRLPVFFSRLAARLALWPAPPLLRSLLEERRKEARKSRQHRECGQPVTERAANAAREAADEEGGREVLLLPARMAIALCRRCLSACEEEGRLLLPCVSQMPVGAEKTNNTEMERTTTGEDPVNFTLPQSDEQWRTQTPNRLLSSLSASPSRASSSSAVGSARRFVGQGVCVVSWEEKEEHEAEKSLALLNDLLSGLRLALWAALECWKETVFHFFPMPLLQAPAASSFSESPASSSPLSVVPSLYPVPLHPAGSSVLPGSSAAHSAAFSAFPFSDPFSRWFSPSMSTSHRSVSACASALWDLRDGAKGGEPWVPSPQGKHELHGQAEKWRRGDTLEGSARNTGPNEGCHSLSSVALELQEVFATLQLTLQNLSSAAVCFCLSRHTQARSAAELKTNLNFTRPSAGKGQSEPEMDRRGWKEGSREEDSGRQNDKEMLDAMGNNPPASSDENAIPVFRRCCEEEIRLMANAKQEGGNTRMEGGSSVDTSWRSSLFSEQGGRTPDQVGECGSEETNPQLVNVETVAQDIRKQKRRLALLRTADEFVRNSVQTAAFLDHISRTDVLPLVTQFAAVSLPRADCVGGSTTGDGVCSEGRELPEESTKTYQRGNGIDDAEDEREVSVTVQNRPPVGVNVEGTHTSLGQDSEGSPSGEQGKRRGVDGTHARRMREMNKCQLPAREHSTEPDRGSTCRETGTESGDLEEDPEPGCRPRMSPCSSPLSSSQGSPSERQLPNAENIDALWEVQKHGDEFCRQRVSARLSKQASDVRARPTAWSAGDLLHSLSSRWTLEAKQLARLRSRLAVGSQNDLSEEDNAGSDSASSETSGRRARNFRSRVPISASPFTTSTSASCEPQRQKDNKDDGYTRRFLDFTDGRECEERLTTRAVAASEGRIHDSLPAGFPEDEMKHLLEIKEGREGQSPFGSSSVSSFDLYGRREGRRRRDEAERDKMEERESTEAEEFAHLMSELVDPTFTDPMSVVDEPPAWLSRLAETDSGISGEATADCPSPAVLRTGFNRSDDPKENKRKKPSLSGDRETARGHQLLFAPGEVPGDRDKRQSTLSLLHPRKIRPVWFSFINSLFNPGSVPSTFRRGEAK